MRLSVIFSLIALVTIFGFYTFTKDQSELSFESSSRSSDEISSMVNKEVVEQASGPVLDLSEHNLYTVPEYVFKQTGLVELNLSDNNLSGSLPAEVRNLSNLKYLNLSDNQFTGVPAEVGQLSKLETLDLSGNQLTGLPHELGNLKDLKTLNLRGNEPSEFDLEVIRKSIPGAVILLD